MPHDDQLRLRHMLDHGQKAIDLASGRTRQDLNKDRLFQLGLTRLVEIVGEAAYQLSPELRQRHPQVPWPAIVSMRHRLIHGYDFVDYDIIWQTVQEDLPVLVAELRRILGTEAE